MTIHNVLYIVSRKDERLRAADFWIPTRRMTSSITLAVTLTLTFDNPLKNTAGTVGRVSQCPHLNLLTIFPPRVDAQGRKGLDAFRFLSKYCTTARVPCTVDILVEGEHGPRRRQR